MGGYPILALADVKMEDGKLVLAKPNNRVTIKDLPTGEVDVYFTIPLNVPSETPIVQPAIPDGMNILLELDVHGRENGANVDQLNVVNGVSFTRQPAPPFIRTP